MNMPRNFVSVLCLAAVALAPDAAAQLAVSAYDGKQVLADGVQIVPADLRPDGVMLIDLSGRAPLVMGFVAVPTSVIGPPASVAVTPDQSLALVTAARRVPAEAPTTLVPDDLLSVIDLRASPPRVIATLHAGAGASGVSINPAGTLALVANRSAGTVSIFTIADGVVAAAGQVRIADAASAPAHVIFFDEGRRALVSRDGDHRISLLTIEGSRVQVSPETLAPGLRPYQIDTAGPRRFAVSANIGGGGRDVDTLALIDLAPSAPRVVDVVAVGLTPEGVKMSPDGRYVATTVNNGSNAPRASAHFHAHGLLQIWRIEGSRLVKVTETPSGAWGQGIAWSNDGRTLLIQSAAEDRLETFRFDGRRLRRLAPIASPAAPAAIRTAEP